MNSHLKFQTPVYVTSPLIPSKEKVFEKFDAIWTSKWLTNHGVMHDELERRLKDVLGVQGVSVFNNGTIALLTALTSLDLPLGSEVITTPFTFPATTHSITWNRLKPVFCDIDNKTLTLDPQRIESLISNRTSAILGVHVYGIPCDVDAIKTIAEKYGLKVVYDAAHAFSTEVHGKAIGTFGDISMFSFHATKLFNTIEGGCLAYNRPELQEKIYYLRNFGIKNEEEVVEVGINGKMNEFQAAVGILNLDLFAEEKRKRKKIRSIYEAELSAIEGIDVVMIPEFATNSMEYFATRINKDLFGLSRDEIYNHLKDYNVFARKYFYPLCSDCEKYRYIPSAGPANLPVANKIKHEVLCLPFYGDLSEERAHRICEIIRTLRP
jgi:dTDP-4-amino-4,6-dideoxygalactose transaminase